MRYLLRYHWHHDAQQFQFGCIGFSEMRNDACNHFAQQSHHCKVVLDKAELGVQADVFVDVARGVVRLGAKDRADLEDALEDAHHDLLVELRALRQERGSPEVVHFEGTGSAFGSGNDDFGCLYLREIARRQRGAKTGHYARAEPQHSAPLWIAVGDNGVIEQRGEVGGDLALVQRYGQYLRHGCNHFDAQVMQFDTAWRLWHLYGFAFY